MKESSPDQKGREIDEMGSVGESYIYTVFQNLARMMRIDLREFLQSQQHAEDGSQDIVITEESRVGDQK